MGANHLKRTSCGRAPRRRRSRALRRAHRRVVLLTLCIVPFACSDDGKVRELPADVRVEATEGTRPADGLSFHEVKIRYTDHYEVGDYELLSCATDWKEKSKPIVGAQLQLEVVGGGAIIEQPPPTDENGETTARVASLVPGTKFVVVKESRGGAIRVYHGPFPPQFPAGAPPDTAAVLEFGDSNDSLSLEESSFTASPTEVPIDGVSTATLTLRRSDGTPVADQRVRFQALGTPDAQVDVPEAITDANGVARVQVSSSTPGKVDVFASLSAQGDPANAVFLSTSVEFVGEVPDPFAGSTLTADPTSGLRANGVDASTITATIRDGDGNPLGGQRVIIRSDGGKVNQFETFSDMNGVMIGRLTSLQPGPVTVRVEVEGRELDLRETVVFDADYGGAEVSVSPDSVRADGFSAAKIKVTLKDSLGNALPGQKVQVSSNRSDDLFQTVQSSDIPTPVKTDTTDRFGVVEMRVRSTAPGPATITITANPGPGEVVLSQQTVTFYLDDEAIANRARIVADPNDGLTANGFDASTITVTIPSVAEGLVAPQDVSVVFVPEPGQRITSVGPHQPDANGTVTTQLTSVVTGLQRVRVQFNGVEKRELVEFDPVFLDAAGSTVEVDPATLPADGEASALIVATLKDRDGKPMVGFPVQFTADLGTITQTEPTTDENGKIRAGIRSATAGTATITTTVRAGFPDAAALAAMPTVQFLGLPVLGTSTVDVAPAGPVIADGQQAYTVTFTARDADGNPAQGASVSFSSTGGDDTFSPASGTTGPDGTVRVQWTSTKAEAKVPQATVNGAFTVQGPERTFRPGAPDPIKSLLLAQFPSVTADDTTTNTLTVAVHDFFGNDIEGATVVLTSNRTEDTIAPATAQTDANGNAQFTIRSALAGRPLITATITTDLGEVTLQREVGFDPGAPSAATSAVEVSPAGPLTANGQAAYTTTLTVRDANFNPVAGLNVTATGNPGGGISFEPASGTTGPDGTFTTQWTATTLGTRKPVFQVEGGLAVEGPSRSFVAGPPDPTTSSVSTSPAGPLPADGQAAYTSTLTVRDATFNPVADSNINCTTAPTIGTLQPSSGQTGTDGTFTTSLTSTTPGTTAVRFGGAGFDIQSSDLPFHTLPPDGQQSSISAQPGVVPADGVTAITVSVRVLNKLGGIVKGATVAISSSRGQLDTITPLRAQSDENGFASFEVRSSTAGVAAISATIDPDGTPVMVAEPRTVSFTDFFPVGLPRVTGFDADPDPARVGQSVGLTWTIEGAPERVELRTGAFGSPADVTGQTGTTFVAFPDAASVAPLGATRVVGLRAFEDAANPVLVAEIGDAVSAGSDFVDEAFGVAPYADGGFVTAGYIHGVATFTGTGGTSATIGQTGIRKLFVARYDAGADLVWAKTVGGTSFQSEAYGVTVDPIGRICATGTFSGQIIFNDGGANPITLAVPSGSLNDAFVTCLAPDGTAEWARSITGTQFIGGQGIAAGLDGRLHLTGNFQGGVDFGGNITLSSNGGVDAFVASVAPDGSAEWAQGIGGAGFDQGLGIAVDPDGSIYTTGSFSEFAAFGTMTLPAGGGSDLYVARLGPDGTFRWVRRAGGSDTGADFAGGTSVTPLPGGGVAVGGGYVGNLAVQTGPTVPAASPDDGLLLRFDRSGSYVSSHRVSGTGVNAIQSVSTLPDGSRIVTGFFSGPATFAPGVTLTPQGTKDVFIALYDPDGSLAWVKSAGGSGQTKGLSVAASPKGEVLIAGQIDTGSTTFGTGDGNETTLTSAGNTDAFVARFRPVNYAFAQVRPTGLAAADVVASNGSASVDAVAPLREGGYVIGGTSGGNLTIGDTTLDPKGVIDGFVASIHPVDRFGNVLWVRREGGTGAQVVVTSVTTDLSGNVTAVGTFSGTATFGEGAQATDLTSADAGGDIFVARYQPDGTLVWAKRFGDTGTDTAHAVTGQRRGSVVSVVGAYEGAVSFGSFPLTSAGSSDAVVFGLDAAGNVTFAVSAGGTGADVARAADTGPDGSVYVTGSFEGSAEFVQGDVQRTLTAVGPQNLFVFSLTPAGAFRWASAILGSSGVGKLCGHGVKVLRDGRVAVGGYYEQAAQLETGGTVLTTPGGADALAAVYSPTGTALCLGGAGVMEASGGLIASGVAEGAGGDITLSGRLLGSISLDGQLRTSAGFDSALVRFNPNTCALLGGRLLSDTGTGFANGIASHIDGRVYVVGRFDGSLDPGDGAPLTGGTGGDGYVIEYLDITGLPAE